jgi:hypothetical protein
VAKIITGEDAESSEVIVMTNDDHAALIEIKAQLNQLYEQRRGAREAADWTQFHDLQAKIDAADAERVEILRRTAPEDEPRL